MRGPEDLVSRVFAAAGMPRPKGSLARTVARSPRERLVRVVAWIAWSRAQGISPAMELTGVRLVIRGWDDFHMTSTIPTGAARVDLEVPLPGKALVMRHARTGRGWRKDPFAAAGAVRPEMALASAWLARAVGCVVHDDCIASPELGAACAGEDA